VAIWDSSETLGGQHVYKLWIVLADFTAQLADFGRDGCEIALDANQHRGIREEREIFSSPSRWEFAGLALQQDELAARTRQFIGDGGKLTAFRIIAVLDGDEIVFPAGIWRVFSRATFSSAWIFSICGSNQRAVCCAAVVFNSTALSTNADMNVLAIAAAWVGERVLYLIERTLAPSANFRVDVFEQKFGCDPFLDAHCGSRELEP